MTILVESFPGYRRITLNRPERLNALTVEMAAALNAALDRAAQTGEVAAEYRVLHRGGRVHWLQARGRIFFDPEGKPAREQRRPFGDRRDDRWGAGAGLRFGNAHRKHEVGGCQRNERGNPD